MYAHVRNNQVMRLVPKENEEINETWIADKDRFSYLGLYTKDRVKNPLIKKDGRWFEFSWEEALTDVRKIIEKNKSCYPDDTISGIVSDNLPTESLYLFQKFIRKLGSNNIDFSLKQNYSKKSSINEGVFNCKLKEIEFSDIIILFGNNLKKEVP